jgi:hypothetical protein
MIFALDLINLLYIFVNLIVLDSGGVGLVV